MRPFNFSICLYENKYYEGNKKIAHKNLFFLKNFCIFALLKNVN